MSSIFPLADFPMFSAGTLAAIAQLFLVVITVRGTDRCVCQPGSTCWPSSDDWDSFNTSVGGSLAAVYPVATPCHNPSFDAAECAQVMMQYTNSTWRAEQIGTLSVREALTVAALQQINWETYPPLTESCYVDWGQTASCSQGNVPIYGVAVESASQISQTVRFASARNLRLVIKNTGHDFLGRSAAHGSLCIWTHKLDNISFSADYRPAGGSGETVGTTVTIGAGVQVAQLYSAVGLANQSVVIALAHSVGAGGGYIQGGGHSPMGPWKGMSTDNTVEFEVITAQVYVLVKPWLIYRVKLLWRMIIKTRICIGHFEGEVVGPLGW